MTLELAHAGHWLVQAVYFVPVIGFVLWLVVTQVKDRRRGEVVDEEGRPASN